MRGAGGPGQAGVLGRGAGCPPKGPPPAALRPQAPLTVAARGGAGAVRPAAHAPCSLPGLPPSGRGSGSCRPAGRHLPSDRHVRNRASSVSPRPWLSGTPGGRGGCLQGVSEAWPQASLPRAERGCPPCPFCEGGPVPRPPNPGVLRLPRALTRFSCQSNLLIPSIT